MNLYQRHLGDVARTRFHGNYRSPLHFRSGNERRDGNCVCYCAFLEFFRQVVHQKNCSHVLRRSVGIDLPLKSLLIAINFHQLQHACHVQTSDCNRLQVTACRPRGTAQDVTTTTTIHQRRLGDVAMTIFLSPLGIQKWAHRGPLPCIISEGYLRMVAGRMNSYQRHLGDVARTRFHGNYRSPLHFRSGNERRDGNCVCYCAFLEFFRQVVHQKSCSNVLR